MSADVQDLSTCSLRRNFIKKHLKNDLLAVDFQWSLFVAALTSYRRDTVLKPYPNMFYKDGNHSEEGKDFKALERCVADIPNIAGFLRDETLETEADSQSTELLSWVLQKPFQLKLFDIEQFKEIEQLTGQTVTAPTPSYIFEMVYNRQANDKFVEKQAGRDLLYAYHGSRLENFYSILNFGLKGHMSKNAMFGEGTYLSAELSICLHYAPSGQAWKKSLLGGAMSCVAVCEVIDDNSVKCQIKSSPGRNSVSGSMAGEVPEKYYVVRNDDVMRVKYLLVYCDKTPPKTAAIRSVASWLQRHKFTVFILCYLFLLIIVGLYNSRQFRLFMKRSLWR